MYKIIIYNVSDLKQVAVEREAELGTTREIFKFYCRLQNKELLNYWLRRCALKTVIKNQ